MPEGAERTTSIKRGDTAGGEDTDRPLATAESTYVATLGRPKDSGGWKHVNPAKEGTTPLASGGSWIKTKDGRRVLDTSSWKNN